MKREKIVLDTNFLLIPETKKIDIFKEIKQKEPTAELIVLKSIKKELERLGKKESKIALQIIEKKDIKEEKIETEKEHVDDRILEYAEKEKATVATNDKELKKRCLKKEIPVVYLRSNKTLWRINPVKNKKM